MTRNVPLTEGEYYHVYNRGNDKRVLFHTRKEWARFLFLLLYGQGDLPIHNTKRFVDGFTKNAAFPFTDKLIKKIIDVRDVELTAFALMPNHFHAIVKETRDGGISRYMQRVLTAYAMYYNKHHERIGHVYQGSFGSTHISDNEQLLYTSAYIHLNPLELPSCRGKAKTYIWSSYQDYVGDNRWGVLLAQDILLDQYKSRAQYEKAVETSGAKAEFTLGRT